MKGTNISAIVKQKLKESNKMTQFEKTSNCMAFQMTSKVIPKVSPYFLVNYMYTRQNI